MLSEVVTFKQRPRIKRSQRGQRELGARERTQGRGGREKGSTRLECMNKESSMR
jgi:hypothetical protein